MTNYPVYTRLGRLFEQILEDHKRVLWGACPVTFSSYQGTYAYAVVFLFPFLTGLPKEQYTEKRIFEVIGETKEDMNQVTAAIREALTRENILFEEPQLKMEEVDKGFSPISAKYIGVRSGLGWIGKNDLLVTPQYGPRFYTYVLVLNEEIDTGVPVTESRCGSCEECVRHCTFHAIKGNVEWKDDGSVSRDDLVDFGRCRDGREKLRSKMGRRMSCARCVIFCPYGAPQEENL